MPSKVIASADNRWVKLARAALSRHGRDKCGAFLVEGARAASEALSSGQALVCLIDVQEQKREAVAKLVQEAALLLVEVVLVETKLFATLCETNSPQGVTVLVRDIAIPVEELLAAPLKLLVVADAVQDPGNLGTLLRIADGAGADALIATSGSVDLYNGKTIRASMGSLFHLKVAHNIGSKELHSLLLSVGYMVVAADPRGEHAHFGHNYKPPLAVVFGNEGAGISSCWRDGTKLVRIPILGRAESLNVGVAAGVLLYEIVRQWHGSLVVLEKSTVV